MAHNSFLFVIVPELLIDRVEPGPLALTPCPVMAVVTVITPVAALVTLPPPIETADVPVIVPEFVTWCATLVPRTAIWPATLDPIESRLSAALPKNCGIPAFPFSASHAGGAGLLFNQVVLEKARTWAGAKKAA
jgi:hypothetical protein